MAVIREWKFVVTVLDEDQEFAKERLVARLDPTDDYKVLDWPGDWSASRG